MQVEDGTARLTLLGLVRAKQARQHLLQHLGPVRRHRVLPVLREEGVERLHHACLVALVGHRDRAECPHDGQAGGWEVRGQGPRHGD